MIPYEKICIGNLTSFGVILFFLSCMCCRVGYGVQHVLLIYKARTKLVLNFSTRYSCSLYVINEKSKYLFLFKNNYQ